MGLAKILAEITFSEDDDSKKNDNGEKHMFDAANIHGMSNPSEKTLDLQHIRRSDEWNEDDDMYEAPRKICGTDNVDLQGQIGASGIKKNASDQGSASPVVNRRNYRGETEVFQN